MQKITKFGKLGAYFALTSGAKFKLLWGSIIHLDIFYLKMRNRGLITTLALLHIFILHRRGYTKNRQNAKSTANYSSHMRAKFILYRRGQFSELELASAYLHSPYNMDVFRTSKFQQSILYGLSFVPIWRTTYHAQKITELLHDYYLVTLSEPLIFLGFSRLSASDLTSVIWREEKHPKMNSFCTDIIILTYGKHSKINGFSDSRNPTL